MHGEIFYRDPENNGSLYFDGFTRFKTPPGYEKVVFGMLPVSPSTGSYRHCLNSRTHLIPIWYLRNCPS
jgi:hypothetical protein